MPSRRLLYACEHIPFRTMIQTHSVEPLEVGRRVGKGLKKREARGWMCPLMHASHANSAEHPSRLIVTIVLFSQGRATFLFACPFHSSSFFLSLFFAVSPLFFVVIIVIRDDRMNMDWVYDVNVISFAISEFIYTNISIRKWKI